MTAIDPQRLANIVGLRESALERPDPSNPMRQAYAEDVGALLAEREEMQRQIEVEARSAAEYRRLAVAYENENGMRNHRAIRAEAEVDSLRSLLREVECSGAPTCVGECCPICGGLVESYWPTPDSYVQHRALHEPNCRLAAALKGTP